jgi:hypothetical protein
METNEMLSVTLREEIGEQTATASGGRARYTETLKKGVSHIAVLMNKQRLRVIL